MTARKALANARAFFKTGEFAAALAQYEYFFDHAIEEEESLYGVRLSYCLDEWARLGSKYPPALQRLQFKAEEAHDLLLRTRKSDRFHDYIAICEYLHRDEAPIELFLTLHKTDRELAQSVVLAPPLHLPRLRRATQRPEGGPLSGYPVAHLDEIDEQDDGRCP